MISVLILFSVFNLTLHIINIVNTITSAFCFSFVFCGGGVAGGAENVRDPLTEVTLLLYDAHLWVLLSLFNKNTTHLTYYIIK